MKFAVALGVIALGFNIYGGVPMHWTDTVGTSLFMWMFYLLGARN